MHSSSQEPLRTIPLNSLTDSPPCSNPNSWNFPVGNCCIQHNKRVGIRLPRTPYPLEILCPGQAKTTYHFEAYAPDWMTVIAEPVFTLLLPAHPLYMLICTNSKAVASLRTPPFEDLASTSRSHTGSETVHSYPASFFGLICSFCRHLINYLEIK